MSVGQPSNEAVQALKFAQDALSIGQRQEAEIDAAKKIGYQAANKIETHEEVCALRAQQTLDKVEGLDKKLDKLISVLLGTAKIFVTATVTAAAGLIVWLIQTNGAG